MPRNPDKTDYSHGFPEGFEVFASINDPRDGGHTLHHFGEILFIAFAAVLCGVRSYELMEEFGELQEKWLRKWLALPHGIPCGGTPQPLEWRIVNRDDCTANLANLTNHSGKRNEPRMNADGH